MIYTLTHYSNMEADGTGPNEKDHFALRKGSTLRLGPRVVRTQSTPLFHPHEPSGDSSHPPLHLQPLVTRQAGADQVVTTQENGRRTRSTPAAGLAVFPRVLRGFDRPTEVPERSLSFLLLISGRPVVAFVRFFFDMWVSSFFFFLNLLKCPESRSIFLISKTLFDSVLTVRRVVLRWEPVCYFSL